MDTIKTKQIEANNKLDITKLQTAAQVEVAGINAKLDMAKMDFQVWEAGHSAAHEAGLQKDQQAHEADLQAGQQDHEKDLAESQQEAAEEAANVGGSQGGGSNNGGGGSAQGGGST
jgi:hypothetical protein